MKTRLKAYRNACIFAAIAIVATILTIAIGENNFLATIWFGVLAACEFTHQTRLLWARFKADEKYHGKHAA